MNSTNKLNMGIEEKVDKALAYLDKMIAIVKKNGTWDGVDVDKYMDEVRGKEPVCEDLEEEYKNYVENDPVYSKLVNGVVGLSIARHFVEWQKAQDDKMVDIIYQQGIEKGKDDMKEQMVKDAVEGSVIRDYDWDTGTHRSIRFEIPQDKYFEGERVKVIIIKEGSI